jgi:hypothetical protein
MTLFLRRRFMEKIAKLDNEVEAQILGAELKAQDIPHFIKSYHDSAYDGLFQAMQGWGHIEAEEEYRGQILEILEVLRGKEE